MLDQRPAGSRLLSWIASAALLMASATSTWAEDEVSITVSKPNAYESNTASGYGEAIVSRKGTEGELKVYLNVTLTDANGNIFFTPLPTNQQTVAMVDYINDFDLRFVLPAGLSNTTDLTTLPPPSLAVMPDRTLTKRVAFDTAVGRWFVAIPAGQSTVVVRVYAWKEAADIAVAENGERVVITLAPDLQNGALVNYSISDQQSAEILIVDGNMTLSFRVDDGIADEQTPPANNATFVDGRVFGSARMWFENSSRRNVTTATVTSFSPNAARKIELTKSGDFEVGVGKDGIVYMTVGGGMNANRGGTRDNDKDIPQIVNRYAHRLIDENGNVGPNEAASHPHILMNEGVPLGLSPGGVLDGVLISVEGVATADLGTPFTLSGTDGTSQVGVRIKSAVPAQGLSGIVQVAVTNATTTPYAAFSIAANIKNGSPVKIGVRTTTTTLVAPAGGGAAVPVVSSSVALIDAVVNNPVMFKSGTSVLGYKFDPNATNQTIPYLGDQIHINNRLYRIIGPTPPFSATHPSGYGSILNSGVTNQLDTNQDFIIIFPPLVTPIMRVDEKAETGFGCQTKFPLTFPAADGNKEVVQIMPMPAPGTLALAGYSPQDQAVSYPILAAGLVGGVLPAATLPNGALPNGDWVDVTVQADEDNLVEGAERLTITANTTTANTGYDILTPQSATIWVQDNDSTVAVSLKQDGIEPPTLTGNGQPALFTVTVSRAFAKDISIPFTLVNDGSTTAALPTVTSAGDFSIVDFNVATQRGTITLVKGALSATIQVDPRFDGVVNPVVKNMGVQLLTSLDYRLLGNSGGRNNSVATATIVDNNGSIIIGPPVPPVPPEPPAPPAPSGSGASGVFSGASSTGESSSCGLGGLGLAMAPLALLAFRRRRQR